MRLRFDSVGGASGDMLLGCLADLGADLDRIAAHVQSALPDPFHFRQESLTLGGLRGTRVSVLLHEHPHGTSAPETGPAHSHDEPVHAHGEHVHPHGEHAQVRTHPAHPHGPSSSHGASGTEKRPYRNLPDILRLLDEASLDASAAALASAAFRRLAEAEAAVHGTTVEKIHFHEVGAVDAIVDVLGSCLALKQLGVTGVSVGPLPEGEGTLECDHGVMPIPAPATAELLRGHPVVRVDEPFELVTPTGAALLMTWKALLPADGSYRPLRNGVGFGQRTLHSRPNLIRATLGEPTGSASSPESRELLVLEANLDDCSGEWLGAALDRLLEGGALDVWHTAIQMKKSRPGVLVSVLCDPSRAEALRSILFAETTTFGIREQTVRRTALDRRLFTVATPYGPVRIKAGRLHGSDCVLKPEYEDCRVLAARHAVSVRSVHDAAKSAALCLGSVTS